MSSSISPANAGKTKTIDNTVAISKDGAAAYAGALVGKMDGAYYYAVDGYWYSLDGTRGNALTTDAATGYGLGDTATIYTSAKNTDTNGDKVITAKELFVFVSKNVATISKGRQHPVMWGSFSDNMPVMAW